MGRSIVMKVAERLELMRPRRPNRCKSVTLIGENLLGG